MREMSAHQALFRYIFSCKECRWIVQGNNQQAIKYLQAVLAISAELQEYTGDADAYGSIADIYADMGEFEKAATYYDNYINKMQEDGQAV